jgi:nucleotide-binding universal stress UspA family protein
MYRRIVVALDGSETSRQALREAIALARAHGAKLRLLHVVDELGVNLGRPATPAEFWAAAHAAGERILAEASARAAKAGCDAHAKLLENRTLGAVIRRVAELIVEDAERWRADLLVVGTQGRRGIGKMLLGSVADGVVRMSPVPVLLVRARAPKSTKKARSTR